MAVLACPRKRGHATQSEPTQARWYGTRHAPRDDSAEGEGTIGWEAASKEVIAVFLTPLVCSLEPENCLP